MGLGGFNQRPAPYDRGVWWHPVRKSLLQRCHCVRVEKEGLGRQGCLPWKEDVGLTLGRDMHQILLVTVWKLQGVSAAKVGDITRTVTERGLHVGEDVYGVPLNYFLQDSERKELQYFPAPCVSNTPHSSHSIRQQLASWIVSNITITHFSSCLYFHIHHGVHCIHNWCIIQEHVLLAALKWRKVRSM